MATVTNISDGYATSEEDAESLGVYYQCFFGANAHVGLTEDDSFAMEDDKGRSWICHPIKRKDVEALDLFKDFPAIKEADEKIGAQTEVRILFCETLRELPTKLADSLE
jgi:hypothetical protein